MTCPACQQPTPCSCVACPQCGELAPRSDASETLDHVCACGWRGDRCACGEIMTFDASARGTTCGGLAIAGAAVCASCGIARVCKRSRPASDVDWKLSKGGRSVDAGEFRVRVEARPGGDGDVAALMARIVRLPELELEVERLREQLQRRSA